MKVQDRPVEKPVELLLMKDENVIQACSSHAPQKTLTDSIGLRGSLRRSKHPDTTGGCHSCNIRPELLVSIPEEVLWSLPIRSRFLSFVRYHGSAHAMRNELHIFLRCLHRLTQCSRMFLA